MLNQDLPTFSAVYTGPAIAGLNIPAILASFTYQITPFPVAGPGVYKITATGIAPSGYVIDAVVGMFTVIGDSPRILPTQVTENPTLPVLLPSVLTSEGSLLEPVNSLGMFQISVPAVTNAFGFSFASFGSQETPFAHSSFFTTSTEQSTTYAAGVKP